MISTQPRPIWSMKTTGSFSNTFSKKQNKRKKKDIIVFQTNILLWNYICTNSATLKLLNKAVDAKVSMFQLHFAALSKKQAAWLVPKSILTILIREKCTCEHGFFSLNHSRSKPLLWFLLYSWMTIKDSVLWPLR